MPGLLWSQYPQPLEHKPCLRSNDRNSSCKGQLWLRRRQPREKEAVERLTVSPDPRAGCGSWQQNSPCLAGVQPPVRAAQGQQPSSYGIHCSAAPSPLWEAQRDLIFFISLSLLLFVPVSLVLQSRLLSATMLYIFLIF